MFTYEFNNGVTDFRVSFWAPFKRFHTCKAAIATKSDTYDNYTNKIETRYDYLVSYATPIALVKTVFINGVLEYNDLFINDGSYDCSATTIKQLSRFLRESEHIDATYSEVKAAIRECDELGLFDTTLGTSLISARVIPVCSSSLEAHAYGAFGAEAEFIVTSL